MARGILFVGSLAWLLAGVAGVAIAAFATPALERLLPPLAIDTDALRGTVIAVGCGLLAVGLLHAVVLIGLDAGRRWASTAAILLGGVLGATLVALTAAAVTSAVATPAQAGMLAGAGLAAGVAALGYLVVVVRLVAARRSGSAF